LEFAGLSEAFTAKFDKIEKLARDKLDGITVEIKRTDDAIHTFIEKTKKDFENFVKVLEGKEVQQNVRSLQQEKEHFMSLSKDNAIASVNKSEVYGNTNVSSIECWPSVNELRAKSKETLNQLKFTKVEWNVRMMI